MEGTRGPLPLPSLSSFIQPFLMVLNKIGFIKYKMNNRSLHNTCCRQAETRNQNWFGLSYRYNAIFDKHPLPDYNHFINSAISKKKQ